MSNRLLLACVFPTLVLLTNAGCGDVGGDGNTATATIDKREVVINGPRDYLGKKGSYDADIMQIAYSERMLDLVGRLKKAQQQNPQLFGELIQQSSPGEPMPYAPGIGLSKEEYNEFLAGIKNLRVEKVGTASMTIGESGKRCNVQFHGALKSLGTSTVDFTFEANANVEMDHITLDEMREIHTDKSVYGAWDGLSFSGNSHFGHAEYSIGVVRETGQHLIHIKGQFEMNSPPIDATVFYGDPSWTKE